MQSAALLVTFLGALVTGGVTGMLISLASRLIDEVDHLNFVQGW